MVRNYKHTTYWEKDEALFITEDRVPANCVDNNGNWKSQDLWIRVIYMPTNKVMYEDHVTIEESN